MKEAVRFWADKVKLSPSQFSKLSDEAKLLAFAVSGIAKGDELETVFNTIQSALSEGISYGEFKKGCKDIFERRGWTGQRAWRVDNIFRTNVQTAFNVGRFKQMKAVANIRPYWKYSAVNDRRTRPTHAALNGKIFRHDHPFWDTWYPCNGFMCRCSVVSLSERQVKKRGLKVETDDITGTLIEPIDPKTGNKMPARLLMPDPGFSYHPGKSVYGGIVESSGKTAGTLKPLPNLRKPEDYRRKALKNVKPSEIADIDENILLPGKKSDAFYKAKFIKQYGQEKVLKDASGEPVILSLRSFLVDKTPGAKEVWKFSKSGHGESIPLMEDMLKNPYEIWLTPQIDEKGKIRLTKRYICLWKTADKKRIGGVGVYEVVKGVFQGVTNFIPFKKVLPDLKYVEKQRQGLLLWKKGR